MKRSEAKIRDVIQNALKERPMKLWELSQKTKIDVVTLEEQIEFLTRIGIAEKTKIKFNGKEITLYQLVHGRNKVPEIKMHYNLWKTLGGERS